MIIIISYISDLFFAIAAAVCKVVLLSVFLCGQAKSTNDQVSLELSAHEGDQIFIPCFNSPEEIISVWHILDSMYLIDELPAELHSVDRGLIVLNVIKNLNGTIKCLSSSHRLISMVRLFIYERDTAVNKTGNYYHNY